MLIIKILILVIILLKAAPYGGNNIKPPWFEGGKVSKIISLVLWFRDLFLSQWAFGLNWKPSILNYKLASFSHQKTEINLGSALSYFNKYFFHNKQNAFWNKIGLYWVLCSFSSSVVPILAAWNPGRVRYMEDKFILSQYSWLQASK